MSDEAVVKYALEGRQSGKSDQQIGKELLARGVTPEQVERLKQKYEDSRTSSETVAADQVISGQRRERPRSSSDTLAVEIPPVPDPAERGADSRAVFGRNVFRSRALTFEPNENQATPENYRLGPGDEVIIDIWGENERSLREEISPEGNIMVEQVGPVYLNGLTIKEANAKLRGVFGQIYAGVSGDSPASEVRVTLGRLRTIQVNVMGEVEMPGTYRLSSFATVFHALYQAGGVTDIGTLRNIRVLRSGREVASVDIYKYLFHGDSKDDIRLEEGDIVLVPSYDLLVEVTGCVKRPMRYEMEAGEPLSQLLAYAGGFTGDAYGREVRVVRTMGREHELFNVDSVGYGTFALMDGDSVAVGRVLDRYANRIEVQGAVYRPGMYELGEGTHTVRELIGRAEGLREDAFRGRALLFRERDDLTPEIVAVDLEGVLSGRLTDISLRRNDVLVVSSVHDLEDRGGFTIGGEVARPGVYPYAAHTTVEDLIVQAGGLLDGASTVKVEVSRRLKDPKSTTPSNGVGKVYAFSLKEGLVVDGEAGFELAPFDVVEVRRSPGYQPQRQVVLDGEVVFTGNYTLIRKNERLSDLVKRAGGITDDAYVRGGRLIRRMNEEERAVRDAALRAAQQNRGADSVSLEKLMADDYYAVGIELDKALSNPGSDYDVVLREGDRLVVPEYVSTVKINGDVMYPNTTVYLKDKRVKYYIAQAGGYGARAKRNKAYIVYMNGRVARVKGRAKVEPGCEIIVPSKRDRKRMGIAEILGLTTSAASIGTMAASIANMTK
ncbi:SLBB domain-containing protein [Alistipes senegalensis]|uniref:SLBB domain-containing protein n=2 Tax=Rikenellaceae TaxID=171550 RepID=A0ABY5V2C8_9BACT|nr:MULTISPECIES: SLBB domain-containing protein [Alistipes]UEA88652.1 SLBB domain-containing protein [Alistipes senegalensis]UWN63755.1 SLBB domain-containing protein [Alistipes senegalensis JC50]